MGNNKYLSNFVQREKRDFEIKGNYDTLVKSMLKGEAAKRYAEKPFESNMISTLENVKFRIEEIKDIMNKDITKDQNNKDNTFPVFLFESTTSDKDAMKALSAKTKKHVKKHKLKYTAGAGAAGGYTASKIKD